MYDHPVFSPTLPKSTKLCWEQILSIDLEVPESIILWDNAENLIWLESNFMINKNLQVTFQVNLMNLPTTVKLSP